MPATFPGAPAKRTIHAIISTRGGALSRTQPAGACPARGAARYQSKPDWGGTNTVAAVIIQASGSLANALPRFELKVRPGDIIKEITKHSFSTKPCANRRV